MHKYLYHVLFPLYTNLVYLFIFFLVQSNISCSYLYLRGMFLHVSCFTDFSAIYEYITRENI
jgi:hypothetical protein